MLEEKYRMSVGGCRRGEENKRAEEKGNSRLQLLATCGCGWISITRALSSVLYYIARRLYYIGTTGPGMLGSWAALAVREM